MPKQNSLTVVLALVGLIGCIQATSHEHQTASDGSQTFSGDYPIKIVCTTGHVGEMIARIAGPHAEVDTLVGPGVDPHLFRPLPVDVKKLSDADAIFYNGMHLEGRMGELFVQMARRKATYAVTEGLQNRSDKRLREPPEFEGMYDPHIWHDPALWSDCVDDMAAALSKFDPKHETDYKQNAAEYVAELKELDAYCKEQIRNLPEESRVLVTAHDAFGYFGKAYELEVHALEGY